MAFVGDTPPRLLPTFAGFPTFAPITFHLLASYSLIAASSAALCTSHNKEGTPSDQPRSSQLYDEHEFMRLTSSSANSA